jgi:UDP:flavonoid glycosyltransferase YjiC (YdhE family)
VVVAPRVLLRQLLRGAAGVVCDAGHTVVCEALDQGVPLVVVPVTADQRIVASQAVRAGTAVRASCARHATHGVDPGRLGRAIETVLTDATLRHGAERVRDSFARAGGATVATDHLEAMLRTPSASPGPA